MAFINLTGLIELLDFDRCSGLFSNPNTISPDPGNPTFPFTWSCAFSPDATKLYISTNEKTSFLFQYDLSSSNIAASKDTLWSTNFQKYTGGGLKFAPDNRIYLSNIYYNGIQFSYPYRDSVFNMYNMYLSVINSPDSLGAACDFQPSSFYLGGKRTYLGLPNNPDYKMPSLTGSVCDTLTSVLEMVKPSVCSLFVYYHPSQQKLFVNAQNVKSKNCLLQVLDVNGRCVFSFNDKATHGYFTHDVLLQTAARGVYLIKLTTEKETLTAKFVKQ